MIGRLDIAHAIATLSCYSQSAREEHFRDIERVFQYLNKYPSRGLAIRDEELPLDIPQELLEKWLTTRQDMKSYYPDA